MVNETQFELKILTIKTKDEELVKALASITIEERNTMLLINT